MGRWWMALLVGWSLAACGLSPSAAGPRAPRSTATPVWTAEAPLVSPTPTLEPTPTAPAPSPQPPDFSALSFAEKNRLYLQWLEERAAAGLDTAEAEALYLRSLEASLNGDSAQADHDLEEALRVLWSLGR